jgi:hypothetical protein
LPSKACSLGRKLWLKVLFADLLYEKNTAEWLIDLVDKLKRSVEYVTM